jgi:hypothetical protein
MDVFENVKLGSASDVAHMAGEVRYKLRFVESMCLYKPKSRSDLARHRHEACGVKGG